MNPTTSSLKYNWDLWSCGGAGLCTHPNPATHSQRQAVSTLVVPAPDSLPSPSPFRIKRTKSPQHTIKIKALSYFETEFNRELNTCPEQLHRDSESCNKEMGNWWGWELWPAVAKHRGKDGGASNLLSAHSWWQRSRALPRAAKATVATLPRYTSALPSWEPESKDGWIILTHFLLYYNCYYLQGPQQRKCAGRAVPLQHKAVPNNPLCLFACTMKWAPLGSRHPPQISPLPLREQGTLLCAASLCRQAQQKLYVVWIGRENSKSKTSLHLLLPLGKGWQQSLCDRR